MLFFSFLFFFTCLAGFWRIFSQPFFILYFSTTKAIILVHNKTKCKWKWILQNSYVFWTNTPPPPPMQTANFVNMHDKVYGLNWRLCGENVACTKDARCEFFSSKFLCTSGWFSSAATDATLKFSSDNELCDFIMEQTSCSHPNWSKEYHWLGEQAVSPHCWSPLAGYQVKSVTLSMLISVFTELHAFVSHVCLTWWGVDNYATVAIFPE